MAGEEEGAEGNLATGQPDPHHTRTCKQPRIHTLLITLLNSHFSVSHSLEEGLVQVQLHQLRGQASQARHVPVKLMNTQAQLCEVGGATIAKLCREV